MLYEVITHADRAEKFPLPAFSSPLQQAADGRLVAIRLLSEPQPLAGDDGRQLVQRLVEIA